MAINSIKRLFVLAGSRGCGKTSFLAAPTNYVREPIPDALQSLERLGPCHLTIHDLARRPVVFRKQAWLHVDLITPMAAWPVLESEQLYQAMRPEMYHEWADLSILRKAREIHFANMVASREVVFQRWLRRTITEPKPTVLKNLVNIYGNPDNNDRLYRRLISAWTEFAEAFPAMRQWVLHADTSL